MISTAVTVFSVMRNDDLPVTITFTTSAGAVVDITGSTVFFTVKASNADADVNAKIAKSWTSHLDPANGITTFSLVPADTTSLLGKYYFDVQVKTLAGLIYTPIHGIFLVLADTRLGTT